PADGADREVDLPQQQHEDDADRDQPDRGDLQHQVGQVLAERKRSFSNWKIAQISARPMTTRSDARSPWTIRRSVSRRPSRSPPSAALPLGLWTLSVIAPPAPPRSRPRRPYLPCLPSWRR